MNIVEQLKELKNVKPRKDWVDAQRELLLSQVTAQSTAKPQSVFVNGWFFAKSLMPGGFMKFVARPVGVLTVLAVFVFSTGLIGVNASKGSLPGDILYPVKLTSERVKVGLTVGEENRAELHVRFAEERVREIEEVAVQEPEPTRKKEKIVRAADGLKRQMQRAQANIAKVKQETGNAEEAVAVARRVDEKTEEISARLEVTRAELSADPEISQTLSEAEDATNETAVSAVEVIIGKHESGEVEISERELVITIERTITRTEERVREAAETAEQLEPEFPVHRSLGEDGISVDEPVVQPAEDNNNTEAAVDVEVEAVEVLVNVGQVQQTSEQAEQMLSEARELLNQGDLTSAIERVRQSAEITREAQESVGNTVEVIIE